MERHLEKLDQVEFRSAIEASLLLLLEFTLSPLAPTPINKPTKKYFWELSLSSFIHAYVEIIID